MLPVPLGEGRGEGLAEQRKQILGSLEYGDALRKNQNRSYDMPSMNALPIIVGALCLMAIAYRYYSAFIAAKVLALDDSTPVPSDTMYDGHNYYPTNKWVLFGHHFAAISGAGPLIGPVLAAQFGFLPGLL